jgi:hypothetical protein
MTMYRKIKNKASSKCVEIKYHVHGPIFEDATTCKDILVDARSTTS